MLVNIFESFFIIMKPLMKMMINIVVIKTIHILAGEYKRCDLLC